MIYFSSSNSYFMKPIKRFYGQLQQALFVRDVYAPMFFCDFINMVIVILFYSQFGVCISKYFSFFLYKENFFYLQLTENARVINHIW
jgi:hypothetical protein